MSDTAEPSGKHVIKNNKSSENNFSEIKKIKDRQHIMDKIYGNCIT